MSKNSKKISLVLEGGGLRGAYTAGCLAWLIDEGIEFDGGYGISVGAAHLISYLFKNKDYLKKISCEIMPKKEYIGIKGYLKEGQIVAYNAMFKDMNETTGFDVKKLKTNCKAKIGLYDLDLGETVYVEIGEMNNQYLISACSLPLLGKVGKYNGKNYLDGGITKMIPIEESIKDGYDAHLIITTKPIDYIRKPASSFVVWLMGIVYSKCKNIARDYRDRHLNYNNQISIINDLVSKGKAVYRYPTRKTNITRLGGSKEDLYDLYQMGYDDMEKIRKDIYSLIS